MASISTGTISSAGIGSGLDVNSIVSQLMAIEQQPLKALATKEATYQAQLSAYGQLQGALSGFQSAMQGLSNAYQFNGVSATSSDSTVASASASATAIAGSYAINVTTLAQAQQLASSALASTTTTVGTGTLTFQFGTWNGSSFSSNASTPSKTVTIDSAHNTLSGIRDAVNAAKIGVTATIVNDGTGYRLAFASNNTGAANSLKITVGNDGDGNNTDAAGLSQLAYDPAAAAGSGKNLSQTLAAQDASFTVNGIGITKSSNTISDVIQGVSLTLLKQSATTTITVAQNTSAVQNNVQNFVKAYNTLSKAIGDLTAYDPSTGKAAILQGDYSTLSILNQVRNLLNRPITGLSGPYTSLSQVGVSFQTDGSLALDSTKLQSALSGNFSAVAGLFASVGQTSDSLVSYVSSTDQTVPGQYAVSVSQLATQAVLNGATTAGLASTAGTFNTPVVLDSTNNTLSLALDGVQSGTITIAAGTYTTTAQLTAVIQAAINGDSALQAAGSTVAVAYDSVNNRLVLTSNRYGSASVVNITSVGTNTAATLGLSAANGTAGVDAAGTIDGVAALGSGQYLTASAGSAQGLKLQILGGALGSRGTVGFSQGYAYQLGQLATQLLGSSGPISSRTDGINQSIKDIDDQRNALNTRLTQIEAAYRQQFTALDTLLGQMQATSSYLTQQLASLPSPGILVNSSSGK